MGTDSLNLRFAKSLEGSNHATDTIHVGGIPSPIFVATFPRGGNPAAIRDVGFHVRTQLLALWRAAADDYLCEPPRRRVRSQRCPWKPPVAFSRDELVQLVAASRSLPRCHPCGLRRSVWWELALRVAWDSGLRFGDMVALRVDQISESGMLAVPQSKTGRIVVVRLSAPTMDLARLSVAIAPRGVLLPWAASHETFAAQFRLLTRKANVRAGQWKWIRRGSATDVELQSPGAASAHLGHAPGSQIAARNYLDPLLLMRCGVGPRSLSAAVGIDDQKLPG